MLPLGALYVLHGLQPRTRGRGLQGSTAEKDLVRTARNTFFQYVGGGVRKNIEGATPPSRSGRDASWNTMLVVWESESRSSDL